MIGHKLFSINVPNLKLWGRLLTFHFNTTFPQKLNICKCFSLWIIYKTSIIVTNWVSTWTFICYLFRYNLFKFSFGGWEHNWSFSEICYSWSFGDAVPFYFSINFLFYQVEGTTERPRLCVFRSNKHLYVQVIDDTKMHTLASASTMQKPISEEFDYSSGPTLVSSQISIYIIWTHVLAT